LVIGAIGFGFAAFSVVAGALAGPKRYNRAKLMRMSVESNLHRKLLKVDVSQLSIS